MRKSHSIILALILAVGMAACSDGFVTDNDLTKHQWPIINGHRVNMTAPYEAVVSFHDVSAQGITISPFCSGTLIAENVVLTAGHCMNREKPSDIAIYFGDSSIEEYYAGTLTWDSFHFATEILVHPQYNSRKITNDIARQDPVQDRPIDPVLRRLTMKRTSSALLFLLLLAFAGAALAAEETVDGKCMTCHKEKSPGLYMQWYNSEHARNNVTCLDCHEADRKDPDAYEHEGATIATLVTPRDCGQCHEKEMEQVDQSHHATAGQILESNDAYLAHAAGGHPAVVQGCESCHGGKVEIDPDSPNKLRSTTWPNSGIGRLNPDGSKGACNTCHTRHSFDVRQARSPESCSKCHLGPDHPQKEIYEESKHGNAYYTHIDQMNLDADRWVVGQDYFQAPTCASCHMSATIKQGITHDVGGRLSWNLRAPVPKKMENWEVKRENMTDVCLSCHGQAFVDGHYYQLDGLTHLYNEKFAKPAKEIIGLIKKKGLLESPAAFSNTIEWEYWELWHHEGRRARHGAAMMGPDYTWWHGIYDVVHNFYFKFLPEARHYADPEVDALIAEVMADPMHQWFSRSTADIKADINSGKMLELYEDLFTMD